MNVLYLISGLSIIALIAELANFRRWLPAIVMAGLAAAAWMLFNDWWGGDLLGREAEELYFNHVVDFTKPVIPFAGILIVAALLWFWLSAPALRSEAHQTDKTALVLFVVFGGLLLCSFRSLTTLFLGIEMLSIPLYILAGTRKDSLSSTEAAFKYFLMGSFATGFLLFGIALTYGATGTFDLAEIRDMISMNKDLAAFFYPGILLIMIGLAFKVSVVPFHFWAPDVYDGSPTMITALMSTVVKIAAITAFWKMQLIVQAPETWFVILQVMMVLTLVVPNITAVYQSSVKRMLAYSSLGHVGFLLLGMSSLYRDASPDRIESTLFYYLTAYTLSSLAAFAVLNAVENESGTVKLDAFRGLGKKSPLLAATMTVAIMSLAGIPPLSGFFAKYLVLALALKQGFIGVVVLAVIMSLVGVFYYFRVIVAMYFAEPSTETYSLKVSTRVILILLVAAIIGSGVFVEYLTF